MVNGESRTFFIPDGLDNELDEEATADKINHAWRSPETCEAEEASVMDR
jgi:hypothetical protein